MTKAERRALGYRELKGEDYKTGRAAGAPKMKFRDGKVRRAELIRYVKQHTAR
jgi:hypothetical protein